MAVASKHDFYFIKRKLDDAMHVVLGSSTVAVQIFCNVNFFSGFFDESLKTIENLFSLSVFPEMIFWPRGKVVEL